MQPSSIVHQLCGARRYEDCAEATGRCWMCAGDMTRGQRVEDFAGASFTGQNRVRCPNATHVCEACVFVCSRIAPVPGRPAKDGKKFGGNFRNYSHLYEQDWDSPAFGDDGSRLAGYINASKGEKPLIRAFLARKHTGLWFAAIADSGQKHVVSWTPLNAPGRAGRVLFDEQIVQVPDDQSLIDRMTAMLTAGATKEEIERGDYTPRAWQLCGDELRAFEREHSGERHGAWFRLALWLAQRDEETVQRRIVAEKEEKANAKRRGKGKAKNADGRGAARDSRGVSANSRRKRPEALGDADHAHARSSENDGNAGRVGNDSSAKAPDTGPKQLRFF